VNMTALDRTTPWQTSTRTTSGGSIVECEDAGSASRCGVCLVFHSDTAGVHVKVRKLDSCPLDQFRSFFFFAFLFLVDR
jgi:hypothetical protein